MSAGLSELISIRLPIKVAKGEAGLWYVSSPIVGGLLVSGKDLYEALDKVEQALKDLSLAALEHMSES